MCKEVKKKFQTILIWLMIGSLTFIGSLGLNLSKAKANGVPSIQFTATSDSGAESVAGEAAISLSSKAAQDVTVDYRLGGTADAKDYQLSAGTATINKGETATVLKLGVIDDQIAEPDETIVIGLYNPSSGVQIGPADTFTYIILNDDVPVTSVTTNPKVGKDGWFKTLPTITLTSDESAKIYYRWNNGDYTEYSQPILPPKGKINTLDYYSWIGSADYNEELPQSLTVKVYMPVQPQNISATTDENSAVKLSWSKVIGATNYEIWRNGTFFDTTAKTSYLDTTVKENKTYYYKVVVVDEAGNKSPFSHEIKITVPKIEKQIAVIEEPKVEEVKVVTPAISIGVHTYRAPQVAAVPKVEEVTPAVEGAKAETATPEETKEHNWNRLLLAISILIIAAGAAIGGYYSYQWYLARKEEEEIKDQGPKSKSRW